MERTYSELMMLPSFVERLDYLGLWDTPHVSPRHMSEVFYKHKTWLEVREDIIIRDLGCDLGIEGLDIDGPIYVHHVNPLTEDDIAEWSYKLFDPENLIACSMTTHNTIHYGKKEKLTPLPERSPGDTILW